MPAQAGVGRHDHKAMAAACVLMETGIKTYKKMVVFLSIHPDMIRKVGLRKMSSKGTIWRAYSRIPEWCLHKIRLRIVRGITSGSLV